MKNIKPKCKDCIHWRDDATGLCCSEGMRVCHGMKEDWIKKDGMFVLTPRSSLVQQIDIFDDTIYPKFITGPEFGCVNFAGGSK